MKNNKTKNLCKSGESEPHSSPDLIGTINNTYHQYPFKAECVDSKIFINLGSQSFSSITDETRTLYMKFDTQPVICRFQFNQSGLVKNKTCLHHLFSIVTRLCYYDPQFASSLTKVDWNLLDNFFVNASHAPSDWQTTTISSWNPTSLPDRTENITSFSTGKTTAFSMATATIPTTTITETDITEETTSFSSNDITTLSTISTAPPTTTFTEFDTTVLLTSINSSTLATSIINKILTSSIESSRSVILTSIDRHEILSSTITTTNADHILGNIFETTSTTLLSISKTSYINVNNNTASQNSSTTSMIPLNRLPPTKVSSSHIKYLILLLSIIGIIVLISCLVYLCRHYRNSSINSLLDSKHSDEAFNSVTTQSELDPSNESVEETISTHLIPELSIPVQQQEQSKTSRKQTSGLFFSKLDSDIL
ncbi:unnamed protein product [Rotaria sp. Silwood2]|nr:unnamed protein product [Rotaria sp. Silwood2]CAF3214062.1 unnamed protein product [Rotaria sp. Silwood2]CAF4433222.1 unnamed protein product [Rotaria sp. Silwood2]CAF4598031.1 unnamed protein product [Rotaria sp. Silwood2]